MGTKIRHLFDMNLTLVCVHRSEIPSTKKRGVHEEEERGLEEVAAGRLQMQGDEKMAKWGGTEGG